MAISIREVETRADRKEWVRFAFEHYRDDLYWVPPIISDNHAYFDPDRNPAFEVNRARRFLAQSGGRTVGRICASVNELEAGKLGHRRGRFGWFESIDDPEVAGRLLEAARDWLRGQQCTEMTGPQGFTDLDPEGLLIEGFERLPTISGSYNPPYYRQLLEGFGLTRDADYIEYRLRVPDESPLLERLRKRYGGNDRYRVVTCQSRRELLGHAPVIWALLEAAFASLYGVVPLTDAQREYYTRKYFNYLDPELVKLPFSREGELVGFFIGMPGLSRALQRARGRLLPFGFLPILRDYRRPETVEFLLAGVKPGEPSAIVTAVTLIDMYDTLRRRGVRFMETNRELEDNTTVNRIWLNFEQDYFRRSRVYRMPV